MSEEVAVNVVIDTNILVPSLYNSTRILDFVLKGNLVYVSNKFIYDEAVEIIYRLWEQVYYKRAEVLTPEEAVELLDLICMAGISVQDMPTKWPKVSRDRDDDNFIWAAVNGKADYLITNDRKHLLKLKNYRDVIIGKPKMFFDWVKETHPME